MQTKIIIKNKGKVICQFVVDDQDVEIIQNCSNIQTAIDNAQALAENIKKPVLKEKTISFWEIAELAPTIAK